MQDVFSKLGPLIIGSRLKRMSDYIMRAGAEFYNSNGVDFEPKWFPLYYLLSHEKELGIMDIAQKLNISHPAVIQLAKELEKKGWVTSTKSKEEMLAIVDARASEYARHLQSCEDVINELFIEHGLV